MSKTQSQHGATAPKAALTFKPVGRKRPAKPLAGTVVATPATKAETKIEIIVDMLRRPAGAAIEDLMMATGWQAHSVRGAIAGAIKRKLNLTVMSEKTEAGRVYRIAGEVKA